MAWRSSGTTNDELVDNLKRFGVISSATIERGFRQVDRKHFVPEEHIDVAHSDQPLKQGNVHISAPHVYGSALEALELLPDVSLSFLNIGSGTGYLSCIVADILGPGSLNYGIDIHDDVVAYSMANINKWKKASGKPIQDLPRIQIIHGNGLCVSKSGESMLGFDRIYIGAAAERSNLPNLTKLLRPGGVLVGPVDDELVKIVRVGSKVSISTRSMETEPNFEDFSQQVLSGVRFAPLLKFPAVEVLIPASVWEPDLHKYYPSSFRKTSKAIMLCSSVDFVQPLPKVPEGQECKNVAAILPQVIWMEILSYCHRNWFDSPQSEASYLRMRLLEEQASVQKANQARLQAEVRCDTAERERDVFRLLARRWQSRVQTLAQEMNQSKSSVGAKANNVEDDPLILALSNHEQATVLGIASVLRYYQDRGGDDSDSEEDIEESEDDDEAEEMVVEEEEMGYYEDTLDEASTGILEGFDEGNASGNEEDSSHGSISDDEDMAIPQEAHSSKSSMVRHQIRTVSISSEDLELL